MTSGRLLRVVLLERFGPGSARGNTVTVERWAALLRTRGHFVQLARPDLQPCEALAPDFVHAHHARHAGPAAATLAEALRVPLVLSLGGTDLNGPGLGPDEIARMALRQATVILGPSEDDGRRLRALLPEVGPYVVVRRGVVLPSVLGDPRVPDGSVRALVLGGLRPVKGQLRAIAWATALFRQGVRIRVSIVGPVLDADYAARVRAAAAAAPNVTVHEAVPAAEVPRLLQEHDLVLNTSESEGASNALLEAWAYGLPVVATDVPGNRTMLRDAPPGMALLLPPDLGDLPRAAAWLSSLALRSEAEHRQLREAARRFLRLNHDPGNEVTELEAAYRRALALGPRARP